MLKIKFMCVGMLMLQMSLNQGVFNTKVIEVDVGLQKQKVEKKEKSQYIRNDFENNVYVSEWVYFDTIPVLVNHVQRSQLKLYENEYYSLPLSLKKSISQITITSEYLNSICGITSMYKVKGCARSEFNDILLDETYRYGDLLHESIHLYSYQNNRVFSDEFHTIYNEEGNRIAVQSGNTHNIYEYYVSAYLLYINDVNYLNQIAPKTKSYFDHT